MILPLAFVLTIALTIWFVVFSDASIAGKAVFAGLFVVSWVLRYVGCPLAGFFLQIALGLFAVLRMEMQKA